MRDIVAVADTTFVRVRRGHPVAAIVEDATGENGWGFSQPDLPLHRLCGKPGLDGFELRLLDDRLVIASMYLAAINHHVDIEPVLQQVRHGSGRERHFRAGAVSVRLSSFGADP